MLYHAHSKKNRYIDMYSIVKQLKIAFDNSNNPLTDFCIFILFGTYMTLE